MNLSEYKFYRIAKMINPDFWTLSKEVHIGENTYTVIVSRSDRMSSLDIIKNHIFALGYRATFHTDTGRPALRELPGLSGRTLDDVFDAISEEEFLFEGSMFAEIIKLEALWMV